MLPSISIDGDRFAGSTFCCIGRSFGLFYRFSGGQVGLGMAVLGTLGRQVAFETAVLGGLRRFGGLETAVSGTLWRFGEP